ncbi:LysR family transcriptional regulator [Nannocystis pusilla]|uniref:LysR family transcriptional regulator n=1 Tax=Nannocystis pusilla TaxID=889268 RepID=UPI003B7953E3
MSSKVDNPELIPALDLNALARFAAVVELGGFSPAARALGVPRQSLHRSIAQLEQVTGVRLLDRGARQVRPTDAGRRLFGHAATILREARDAHASLRAARGRPRGRLRLTAPHLFAEQFLIPLIEEFLATWPEVQIDADFTVAHSDLIRDDYDLAIRLGDRPTHGRYVVMLGSVATVCCVAPAYLAAAPPLADPQALSRHSVLAYGPHRVRHTWRFERAGETVEVDLAPRLRADSARLVLAACRAGLGVARLPEFLCAGDVSAGSLVPVWVDWQIPRTPIWVLYSSRSDKNPTLHAFLDRLKAHLLARM